MSEYMYDESPESNSENKNSALSIVSLVMGIISIVLGCCYGVGFLFAIPGLVCGIIAKRRGEGGLATAGIVCSIVGMVIAIAFWVLIIWALNYIASDPVLYEQYMQMLQSYY